MKIRVELEADSWEELVEFTGRLDKVKAAEPVPVKEEAPAEPEPEPEPAPTEPEVKEEYRTEVRAMLAKVNKKTGENTARELIMAVSGKTRLTDVPLPLLPELMEKAKEALNA